MPALGRCSTLAVAYTVELREEGAVVHTEPGHSEGERVWERHRPQCGWTIPSSPTSQARLHPSSPRGMVTVPSGVAVCL